MIQPYFSYDRSYQTINASRAEKSENMHMLHGIGYQLRAFSYDDSTFFESESRQPAAITGTLAVGHVAENHNRDPGLLGVSAPDTTVPVMPMFQKKVEAGGSWEKKLSADQASFPGPAVSGFDMDRVFVSSSLHDPQDKILFGYSIPGSKITVVGVVARVYFNGPAGADDILQGDGIYCLAVRGDGNLELYERGGTTWKLRAKFQYQAPTWASYNQLIISTNANETCSGQWRGSTISIAVKSHTGTNEKSVAGAALDIASKAIEASIKPASFVYRAPRKTKRPTQQAAIRLDLRRDVRAKASVLAPKYPTTGFIEDEPIAVTGRWLPGTFTFEWYGTRPSGTTVAPIVSDADTGDDFAGEVLIDDCLGQQIRFTIPDGATVGHIQVRFEVAGPGTATPTITNYRILKNPITLSEPLPVTLTVPTRAEEPSLPSLYTTGMSISGTGDDPAQESANFEIIDQFGEGSALRAKAGTPVEISVVDDEGSLITYLHRGYIRENESRRLSKRPEFTFSRRYSLSLSGEHEKLQRALTKNRILLAEFGSIEGHEYFSPAKATEALKLLFVSAGYAESQFEVPDLDIRLWGEDQQVVEVSTRAIEPIKQIVDDYLGGHLLYDRNAGDDGMWRVIPRRHAADYRFLARFTPEHPGAGRIPTPSTAYGVHDYGDYDVPVLPMMDVSERLEPAEANFVSVNGGNFDPTFSAIAALTKVVSWAANFDSFNFYNLPSDHAHAPDPASRDYLGEFVGIDVWDMSLKSQEAADWIARRVFDVACHARTYLNFTSWLEFVTDPGDLLQARPRPLRFYDMVQVYEWETDTWQPYVVVKCSPRFRKAGAMMAEYTLMSSTVIGQFAAPRSQMSVFRMETKGRRAQSRAHSGMPTNMPTSFATSKALSGAGLGFVSVLPTPVSETLQYLDPAESNFGQFKPMAGYDPSA